MSKQEQSRRELILSDRESITRSTGVLIIMTQSFFDDVARGTGDADAALQTGSLCLEAAMTMLNLLRYAGLSEDDIASIGEQVDQEREALARLSGEVS